MNQITPELSDQTSVGYLVNLSARLFSQALYKNLSRYEVKPGQFPVILWLLAEKKLSQKELCEKIRVEQPTMANTLKRMERDGLITRESDIQDKRSFKFTLTDKVLENADEIKQIAQNINETALHRLSKVEKDIFVYSIKLLNEELNKLIEN